MNFKNSKILNIDKNINSPFYIPTEDINYVFKAVGDNWEQLKNQKLLLTGGTGFIGKWILSTFLHANRKLKLSAKVFIVSRNPEFVVRNYPLLKNYNEIYWIKKDIRQFDPEDSEECSYCIHAATDVAAIDSPINIFDTCVFGTKKVLDAMKLYPGRKRILVLSSGAVYGGFPSNIKCVSEDFFGALDLTDVSQAYGVGKRASEFQSIAYASENSEFEIVISRLFALVGPYLPLNKHFAIGNFIQSAIENKDIIINGDGTPLRSYLYTSDLTHWLWKLLFNAPKGRSYNVGGMESISILDLALKVNKLIGGAGSVKILGASNSNTLRQSYLPSLNKIFEDLNLKETINLDTAIIKTGSWAKKIIIQKNKKIIEL
jgi:dTDP-glucose 4,6-dehydratase